MIDTHREREAETQEEGKAGSLQGARRGTRSRDSRIAPWAKGRPPRDPLNPHLLILQDCIKRGLFACVGDWGALLY